MSTEPGSDVPQGIVIVPARSSWRRPALLVALASIGVGTTPARAQPAPIRQALDAFRDSLGGLTDSAAIRALESRLMVEARRDRSNPVLHLRLGLVSRRLGAARDAAAEFKWATQLEPRWATAWFLWALAELDLGDEPEPGRGPERLLLTRNAWGRAETAVGRAVEIDRSFAVLAEHQAAVDAGSGRPDRARVFRRALTRTASSERGAQDAPLLLAAGRVERLVGDSTAAVEWFERAALLPGGRAAGLLERARTQLTAGDRRGIQAYFDGAAEADSASIEGYRLDLALVAHPGDLVRFDQLKGAERSRFLWEFWTSRDRAELRQNGERLVEHYRRLALARSTFGGLDDLRARVLVRQGEPASRASLRLPALPANESWWYRRAEADFVVHFVARADSTDFELRDSLLGAAGGESVWYGAAGDEPVGGRGSGVEAERVLQSRAQLAPFYQAAAASRSRRGEFWARERELSLRGRELALATDRYPLQFARDLPARIRMVGLAGDPEGTGVHVLFSIPGFAAGGEAVQAGYQYPVRVRAVIRDRGGEAVRAIDTLVRIERQVPVAAGETIAGRVMVPMPPGQFSARVAVQVGDAGALLARDSLRLPEAGADVPALLDLLLAGPAAPLTWYPLGGAAVAADAAPVVQAGDTLAIYGELVGPRTGGARVRLLVRPAPFAGPAERWRALPSRAHWLPVSLEPGPGEWSVMRVRVPIRGLRAGAYELQVVVVDGSGATAWQQGRFEVADRGRR